MVAIVKKCLKLDLSLHAVLQILTVTSFEKTLMLQLLTDKVADRHAPDNGNQLIFVM
jgi:hypothetical protein